VQAERPVSNRQSFTNTTERLFVLRNGFAQRVEEQPRIGWARHDAGMHPWFDLIRIPLAEVEDELERIKSDNEGVRVSTLERTIVHARLVLVTESGSRGSRPSNIQGRCRAFLAVVSPHDWRRAFGVSRWTLQEPSVDGGLRGAIICVFPVMDIWKV
jgi:hypothetical protein